MKKMSQKKISSTVILLFMVIFSSGCASQGWQKFSPQSVEQKASANTSGKVKQQLEVFIFAEGEQAASQTVIDI